MDTQRFKYPRTRHLPSSQSATADDKHVTAGEVAAVFGVPPSGHEVVVTEKMDGEATTIYSDGYSHARSTSANPHPSRDRVRALAASMAPLLPEGWRVCGENLYAVHSVEYSALPSHFMIYSIWDGENCLSWNETVEWAALLGLTTVPVLYRGPWLGEAATQALWNAHRREQESLHGQTSEGWVVRTPEAYAMEAFGRSLFKWVRSNHVQTKDNWLAQELRVNSLQS